MRPVNIVLLVLAGALGGAVLMRVTQPFHAPQVTEVTPDAPEPMPPVVKPLAPAPASEPAAPTQPQASPSTATDEPMQPVEPAVKPTLKVAEPKRVVPAPKPVRRAAITPPKRVEFQHSTDARPAPARPTISEPAQIAAKVSSPPPAVTAPTLTPEQPKETPPARVEPENSTPAPAPSSPAPEPHTVTLNAGTLIPVRLIDGLSLERNHAGDRFAATLDHELVADGFVIAERGARVDGRVVTADRSAKTLGIELERVETSDRQDVAIQTERFDKHSQPDHAQDATKIGAGAVIGAVIGGIAGGGKGAAIGAGVGGGAGAGAVLATRQPVSLPSETRITFRLRAPVTITEQRN